jgi:hypothetical protein
MSPKKKTPKKQEHVPDGLAELIKTGISTAFSESSDAAGVIKVTQSKIPNVDFQFNIRPLKKDPNDVIVKIRESIPVNDIIERLEISENQSYVNIITKIKRTKSCKTCSNQTTLGRQILPTNVEQNLLGLLTTELSRRILKYNLGNNQSFKSDDISWF